MDILQTVKKINNNLKDKVIQGVHLSGVDTAVDMWYPYLWMLGGSIVESRPGHPTKDFYWFPGYNGTQGVKALEFIKDQSADWSKPTDEVF